MENDEPFLAILVYFGNYLGVITSLLGALILLYASWQTL
jgi:hypothetical protein